MKIHVYIMRIMKLAFVLMTFFLVQVSAESIAQRITLSAKNASLEELFKDIRRQTGYDFVYNPQMLQDARRVDITVAGAPLGRVLELLFASQALTYTVDQKTIVVRRKPRGSRPAPAPVQEREVKGAVSDTAGIPLPGVSVTVKGTGQGSVTGEAGEYALGDVPEDAVLVFSYVGFQPQEVPLNGKRVVNAVMRADREVMDELIVVGYGTQKKVNLTGAVSQVDARDIADRPAANLSQVLQGVVPNLNITFSDGHPGSQGTYNIRGFASITNTSGSPLILIDGVPGSIDMINPHDVESISVLKDAASSAIYGARGAFGVILVTTKQGEKGKLSVSYNTNYSLQRPTTSTDFMTDGYTQARLTDEAFIRSTGTSYTQYTEADYEELRKRQTDPSLPPVVVANRNGRDMYLYYGNTDWWNTFFRDVQPSMEHALNLSGGGENVDFLLSGRYYNQKGMMQLNQDRYNVYNLRIKVNARVNSWLTLSGNTQFNANDYTYPGFGYNSNFVLSTVHALASYVPANPDGTFTYRPEINNGVIGDGLYADLQHGRSKGGETRYEFMNIIGADLDLGKGFTVTGNYTFNLQPGSDFQRRTEAPWSVYPGTVDYVGFDRLDKSDHLDRYHVVNAYGQYEKEPGDHGFRVMAGYNQELRQFRTNTATRFDLLSENLNELELGTGDAQVGSNAHEWSLLGFFGRINYHYKNKYLLELNGRYDGSSRFPAGNRFGFFPSVSAGWRISEEAFFQPLKSRIPGLKLRGSYGSLGNQQISSSYPYIPVLNSGTGNYISNGSRTQYLRVPDPVDPDFTWEKAATVNAGIDLELFDHRLQVSFDRYRRETTDMIAPGRTLPAVFGAASPEQNAADLVTNGFDLSLSWNSRAMLGGRPFSYHAGVVLSDYTAEITRFDNPGKLLDNYYEGQQLGEIWGYSIEGYFASDAEAAGWINDQSFVNRTIEGSPGEWGSLRAGDLKFRDLNGDQIINNGDNTAGNPGDRRVIGNSLPRYSFGINGGASWNGFDLAFLFQGIGRQDWYPGTNADKFWGFYSRSYFSFIPEDFESKIWTPENPDAYFPRLRAYTALNSGGQLGAANDRYLQNLAFIRLKSLVIGYSLPASFLQQHHIEKLRVYFSGQNLFTLTSLETDYIDPEQAIAEANGRTYPFFRSWSLGLTLSF